jgi:DNA adenine methylase
VATTSSPLRYPGGKSALTDFLQRAIEATGLRDPFYAEPYCGGAGAAIGLLRREVVSDVFLNDIDPAIFAFWLSVRDDSKGLCQRVLECPLTLEEWERQREVLQNPSAHASLELGFACLFLNRTNRSGVLTAGPIGGKNQKSRWGLDARFNRKGLVEKIQRIARYRSRLHVFGLDAEEFLSTVVAQTNRTTLTYLDPPYYQKGQCLYANHYQPADHRRLASVLRAGIVQHWIASYDNVPAVRRLYRGFPRLTYSLAYSASQRYQGREVMFFSPEIRLPAEVDPFVRSRYRRWQGRLTVPLGTINPQAVG